MKGAVVMAGMSRKLRSFLIGALGIVAMGLFGTAFVPKAHADTWSKIATVSVSEPLVVGNQVLHPGTYVWKLMDSRSEQPVVQVFDENRRRVVETVAASRNYRLRPTGDSQFAYADAPAGVPKVVRAWFYPGDNCGEEFAYPTQLVTRLAAMAPPAAPVGTRPAKVKAVVAKQGTATARPRVAEASMGPLVGWLGLASMSAAGLFTLVSRGNPGTGTKIE